MFKKILFALIVLIAVFCAVAYMQPSEFKVSRTITIAAPADKIFPHVNDLHQWQAWSPWAKLDPKATTTFAGPNAGEGAIMSWEGNMKVGAGSMTIVESKTNESVKFRLDFLKPLAGTNQAEFTFKPEDNNTVVTWDMQGEAKFINKAMNLIFNCEKMIGENFEKGLADLKTISETGNR
jgi:carbon monoxide dehydrogenase subunit G